MTKRGKIWLVSCCLLVLGSAAAAYLGSTFYNQQINPSLKLTINTSAAPAAVENDGQAFSQLLNAQNEPVPQAVTQTPAETVPARPALAQNTMAPVKPAVQPAPAPPSNEPSTANAQSHCGYSGTMIILFLGIDERDCIPYGADFIRFFKIDFSNRTVTCAALSRDLWVKTPALADKGIKENRLGEVFDIVQTSTKGTLQEKYLAATTVITQTIFDNFGVAPDRYLTVPQSNFATLVDSIGGIEVEVPQDQDVYKHVILVGKQTLNGQQALSYIRLFEGYGVGDFGRNSRQLPFIKAVIAKMVEPANLVKIPGLVSQLQQNIITDLSPARIASLICMLEQVQQPVRVASTTGTQDQLPPRGNVSYHAVTPDMTSPGPQASLLPDTAKIQAWLQELLKK